MNTQFEAGLAGNGQEGNSTTAASA